MQPRQVMATGLKLVFLIQLVILASSCSSKTHLQVTKQSFDGRSEDLKATEVVPTLQAPVRSGHNVVWCVSFLAAWKTLAAEIAKEDIAMEGSPELAALLNRAADPRPHIPKGALYVATGWKQQGVVEKIHSDLRRAFPEKATPTFPDVTEDSFVVYSYLEAKVRFSVSFFQSHKPLVFTDSHGRKTNVTSFGIRPEDEYAYNKLRAQPRILFRKGEPKGKDLEFALDLCGQSSPSQIVVARIKQEPTLAAALARVEREQAELTNVKENDAEYASYLEKIGPNDVLLVPDLFWQISHRFSEVEGKAFANPKLKGQRLDIAQQDILFRLDRSGAALKSESMDSIRVDSIRVASPHSTFAGLSSFGLLIGQLSSGGQLLKSELELDSPPCPARSGWREGHIFNFHK